ncbi:MAG: SpoIIE family protein phosphatase, partial [Actinomycetota bacterium]
DVAAFWEPAESLGGDYYDLVDLPDGRLGVVVADVSGHGFGPSLIMASARAMVRVLVLHKDLARARTLIDEHDLGRPGEVDWSQVDVGEPE